MKGENQWLFPETGRSTLTGAASGTYYSIDMIFNAKRDLSDALRRVQGAVGRGQR